MLESVSVFWDCKVNSWLIGATEYRSAIFTYTPEQDKTANAIMEEVQKEHWPSKKIVTEIVDANQAKWWDAEVRGFGAIGSCL